jgi:outer membrane protein, multidrug efflux system
MPNVKTMKKQFVSAAIIITLITSSVLAQKNTRPSVKTPDTFRGVDTRVQADLISIGELKWFEVFQDEELQKLIRTAFVQNYDLRQAVARVNAARANLGIRRSEQFPQFEAGADITTLGSSRNGQNSSFPGFNRKRTFGEVLIGLLSFELDVWGRLRKQTKAARAELAASEEDRRTVMTLIVGDVATNYFRLTELDAELRISQRTLATREHSLRLIRSRQREGVATRLDVRQAEQLVYSAAQTIHQIERASEETENQISLLIGQNPASIARGQLLDEQKQPPSVPTGLPSSLLERRPDIRAAEQLLIAADANVGVAKAAYFPRISLTGFLGFQSDQLSSLFSGPSGVWSFVPQLTQPIFTAGRLKSNVRFAKAQQEFAVVEYERRIQTAFSEVSNALVEYRQAKEIRTQQELLTNTLRDRSRLAYIRYQGGIDTLLSALDADRDLFDAELSLAQTKRDELVALVQLYKALGGGWQS